MTYKEFTIRTHQSMLVFKKDTVEKNYKSEAKFKKNRLSSVKNEMYCLNKFSNKNVYAPEIIKSGKTHYIMKRYDFGLGSSKRIDENGIRRLLFTCSLSEIFKQIDEIENILNKRKIIHKDINPGNLLFCEKERVLKLIDFYWASTDHIDCSSIKGVNGIYGKDQEAFIKIKKQIAGVDKKVRTQVKGSKKILSNLGKVYLDGSAAHRGKTYHPIDIHYYKKNLYHKDIDYDFQSVIKNINSPIESVIDTGCAAGYYLFNLRRIYKMKKIIGYEADPNMLSFLKTIKNIFCLNEIELNPATKDTTKFQDVDLALCMNVHMWMVKQLGKRADIIISNLIKHSKVMFFQTCGVNNSGRYKVKYLKSTEDIQKYLEGLSGKKVTFIDFSKHGGKRSLFKIGN